MVHWLFIVPELYVKRLMRIVREWQDWNGCLLF